jgi:signal transduction histidine kinase
MRTRTLALRASSASPHTPSRSLDAGPQSAPTATGTAAGSAGGGAGGSGSGGGAFNPPASVERWLLTCSIRDTGIGITGEQMQLLFQTFSQVQHMSGE